MSRLPSTPPAISARDGRAIPLIPSRIARDRKLWANSYFWLGKSGKAHHFQWARFKGEVRLCTTKDIETYLEEKKKPLYRELSPPFPDEVDDLTVIVKVSMEDFNFQSCGRWNGARQGALTFADVRLSFIGVAPAHPKLAADFKHAIRNLKEIIFCAQASTTDARLSGPRDQQEGQMKFEHTLFEKLAHKSFEPGRFTLEIGNRQLKNCREAEGVHHRSLACRM